MSEYNPQLMLYEAALQGNVFLLQELINTDPLLLHRPLASSAACPLHVACKLGHTQFVSELLYQNPNLWEELDPNDKSTVLHIAVRNGHLELVNYLVSTNPSMCFLRDTHGRTPVHVAVVKGHLHVLDLLLRFMPAAAKERVGTLSGDTIMHLCVYYNHLDALKLVMKVVGDSGLLNATNVEGNTILHVAVANKHLEIVGYLLSNRRLNKNTLNSNGMTAMDLLKDSGIDRNNDDELRLMMKREKILRSEDVKRKRERVKHVEWMEKQRSTLMVVASLIATMAFQAGINPPGGVWQDDGPDNNTANSPTYYTTDSPAYYTAASFYQNRNHIAGTSILVSENTFYYILILACNSIGFVLSMSSILLLISGFPCRRFFMVAIMVKMWVAISIITFSYGFSVYALTTTLSGGPISIKVLTVTGSGFGLIGLLTFGHIIMWTVRLVKHSKRRA